MLGFFWGGGNDYLQQKLWAKLMSIWKGLALDGRTFLSVSSGLQLNIQDHKKQNKN